MEFPCGSRHQGNQDSAAVSYQVKLLDRNDHSALPVVVSTGTTSSQDLDCLIMPCLNSSPGNHLTLIPDSFLMSLFLTWVHVISKYSVYF